MQREMTEEEQSYMESQQKLFTLYKHRNMNVATAQALEKERKISQLTLIEMKNIPQDNVCYKSIGRMFIQKSKDELDKELNTNIDYLQKKLDETTESRNLINKKIGDEESIFRDVATRLQEKARSSQAVEAK